MNQVLSSGKLSCILILVAPWEGVLYLHASPSVNIGLLSLVEPNSRMSCVRRLGGVTTIDVDHHETSSWSSQETNKKRFVIFRGDRYHFAIIYSCDRLIFYSKITTLARNS